MFICSYRCIFIYLHKSMYEYICLDILIRTHKYARIYFLLINISIYNFI